jgi:hypothetical protein
MALVTRMVELSFKRNKGVKLNVILECKLRAKNAHRTVRKLLPTWMWKAAPTHESGKRTRACCANVRTFSECDDLWWQQ